MVSGVAQEFSTAFLTAEAVKQLIGEVVVKEAMKFVPMVGGIFAAASEFWFIRWLGFHVTKKAKEAAEMIQSAILEDYERDKLALPMNDQNEINGNDIGSRQR